MGLLRYPIILDVFFFKILDEKLLQHSRNFNIDNLIEKKPSQNIKMQGKFDQTSSAK